MTTPIGNASRIDDLQATQSLINHIFTAACNHIFPFIKDAVDSLVLAVFEAARYQDSSEDEKVLHEHIHTIKDIC